MFKDSDNALPKTMGNIFVLDQVDAGEEHTIENPGASQQAGVILGFELCLHSCGRVQESKGSL